MIILLVFNQKTKALWILRPQRPCCLCIYNTYEWFICQDYFCFRAGWDENKKNGNYIVDKKSKSAALLLLA